MKDLTLSIVGVLALALAIGLVFRWLYPLVEISANLAGLFVFAAVVLRLVCAKLWAMTHKAPTPAPGEAAK